MLGKRYSYFYVNFNLVYFQVEDEGCGTFKVHYDALLYFASIKRQAILKCSLMIFCYSEFGFMRTQLFAKIKLLQPMQRHDVESLA